MATFKRDDSFLEKISIGAVGTQKVFEHLKQDDHIPIELERGSMSYKIWKKIKIKRIRVPDILCVNNGIRIESRAKTKLEITMSHSVSDPERGWDSGLKDNDYVALVVCKKIGERAVDWLAEDPIQYIAVKDLREAEAKKQAVFVKPKGATEGFEARITWPASIASASGVVKNITGNRIQFLREPDKRVISLNLTKKGIDTTPLVRVGEKISENQIIASTVPVSQAISSQVVNENYYLSHLESTSLSDRYTAVKALSLFTLPEVKEELIKKLGDENEHIYVKLEAAAGLAKFGTEEGYNFITLCLGDSYLQNVLEAVIILSEIQSEKSSALLAGVLEDVNQDAEIRAGAAWGLGELNGKSYLPSLIKSFDSIDVTIKEEAARALAKLTGNFSTDILHKFRHAHPVQKPGLAWALTKSKTLTLAQLIEALNDEDSRHWISYIIGMQGEETYVSEIERLKEKDPEVYFAVTVLWKIMSSWVYQLTEY